MYHNAPINRTKMIHTFNKYYHTSSVQRAVWYILPNSSLVIILFFRMFCSRTMNTKVNRIHERALRLVYQDYKSSFEELLDKDKSLCFHHRNIHQVAIEMFKVKHDLSPPFMKDIFKEIERETRSGTSFLRPKVNSVKRGDRSLRSFGPIVWNTMLPDALKKCDTLDLFKHSIKTWKPDNCPCELCKVYIKGLGYTVLSQSGWLV